MLSVCLATYNGEKYIRFQISSILTQLGDEDELLISDDGSSDSTLDIINSFDDQRIRVLKGPGKGVEANFESLICYSKGDYILLSDQDDIWMKSKVSNMKSLLYKYTLVCSDAIIIDGFGHILHNSLYEKCNAKFGLVSTLCRNSYVGCTIGFRRELIKYILPFPKMGFFYGHDWWIGIIAELFGNVHQYERPLIYYRRHGSNVSKLTESSSNSFVHKVYIRFRLINYLIKRITSVSLRKYFKEQK